MEKKITEEQEKLIDKKLEEQSVTKDKKNGKFIIKG